MAQAAGIPDERIMIDAGLDLGKTPDMSALLFGSSEDLTSLGRPVFLRRPIRAFSVR
ncbi:MAG: hypothetical protein Ct9H300mP12_00540 [Acidimicrobiales bacterium]|nr:MAG: hypothetical protein Ct9H300mP12_00540 [Acidimicrobiales bacterium]